MYENENILEKNVALKVEKCVFWCCCHGIPNILHGNCWRDLLSPWKLSLYSSLSVSVRLYLSLSFSSRIRISPLTIELRSNRHSNEQKSIWSIRQCNSDSVFSWEKKIFFYISLISIKIPIFSFRFLFILVHTLPRRTTKLCFDSLPQMISHVRCLRRSLLCSSFLLKKKTLHECYGTLHMHAHVHGIHGVYMSDREHNLCCHCLYCELYARTLTALTLTLTHT